MNKLIVLSILAILACAFAAPSGEDAGKKIREEAAQQCRSELNVNEVDAKIIDNRNQLPANEAQACYIECIGKKIGQFKDGKLDHDGFIAHIKTNYPDNKEKLDEAEKLFQKCQPDVDKRANAKCGAGAAMRACVIQFFHLQSS